jgi:hypothetical protein
MNIVILNIIREQHSLTNHHTIMTTSHLFTVHHHLADEGIALYVDALRLERAAELPDDIRIHVEGCEACQQQIVESHELMKAIPADRSLRHPFFDGQVREPAVRYTPYRIAAVLAGAALLAGVYYTIANRGDGSDGTTTERRTEQSSPPVQAEPLTDTAPNEPPKRMDSAPLLADNFIPSPNLEDLVGTEFRSTTVDVLSPLNGDTVVPPIRFAWEHAPESITIKILTNRERTVISETVKGNAYTVRKKFAPGLYYWKLETKTELAYVGKFFVK